jgi:hypothetical protein
LDSPLTILPQHFGGPSEIPTDWCLVPPAGSWAASEWGGHRTEGGGMPPDGIPGPPSPRWCSISLSSLDLAWTPRRSGPTHLAVLSRLGKQHPQGNQSKVRSHPTGRKGSLIHSREPLRGVPQVRESSKMGGRKTVITLE